MCSRVLLEAAASGSLASLLQLVDMEAEKRGALREVDRLKEELQRQQSGATTKEQDMQQRISDMQSRLDSLQSELKGSQNREKEQKEVSCGC